MNEAEKATKKPPQSALNSRCIYLNLYGKKVVLCALVGVKTTFT